MTLSLLMSLLTLLSLILAIAVYALQLGPTLRKLLNEWVKRKSKPI
jgi:hypothetical protein